MLKILCDSGVQAFYVGRMLEFVKTCLERLENEQEF